MLLKHFYSRFALLTIVFAGFTAVQAQDPLPSWKDGAAKEAIVDFVKRVTKEEAPSFVPPAERIAVFDNDGTLWCEQPIYVQAAFALARVKQLAPQHPEWKDQEPFKSVLAGNLNWLGAPGAEKEMVALMMATHAGMTPNEFDSIVKDWLATARHPMLHRPYTACVYQPMLELLAYLRANGFKTFIVSGGGVEFMRPWAEKTYGIPPEQVVGSSIKLKYELRGDQPVLMRLPEVDFVDDGPGKPIGIQKLIGRRPLAAFGNSDGDYEMLRWTTSASGARFGLLVHHTDADREYAYDRDSHIGKLSRALDEAPQRGWHVVNMRRDWKVVFPPQP